MASRLKESSLVTGRSSESESLGHWAFFRFGSQKRIIFLMKNNFFLHFSCSFLVPVDAALREVWFDLQGSCLQTWHGKHAGQVRVPKWCKE